MERCSMSESAYESDFSFDKILQRLGYFNLAILRKKLEADICCRNSEGKSIRRQYS